MLNLIFAIILVLHHWLTLVFLLFLDKVYNHQKYVNDTTITKLHLSYSLNVGARAVLYETLLYNDNSTVAVMSYNSERKIYNYFNLGQYQLSQVDHLVFTLVTTGFNGQIPLRIRVLYHNNCVITCGE